jgi:hypothetical protein
MKSEKSEIPTSNADFIEKKRDRLSEPFNFGLSFEGILWGRRTDISAGLSSQNVYKSDNL